MLLQFCNALIINLSYIIRCPSLLFVKKKEPKKISKNFPDFSLARVTIKKYFSMFTSLIPTPPHQNRGALPFPFLNYSILMTLGGAVQGRDLGRGISLDYGKSDRHQHNQVIKECKINNVIGYSLGK